MVISPTRFACSEQNIKVINVKSDSRRDIRAEIIDNDIIIRVFLTITFGLILLS